MIKLRNILQSKYIIIFLIVILIISFYRINNYKVLYQDNISGIVKNVIKNNDKTNIYINNVLVIFYGDLDIEIGSYINVYGKYKIPSKNTNFHLFNYSHYLKGNGIDYIIVLDSYDVVYKNKNILYKLKNIMINTINNHPNSKYLKAFLLGDKTSIDSDVTNSFKVNGISHLFAISGMHVSLLSIILLFILNRINKKDYNYLIIFIFLLFYSFLVNFTPSILRAVFFYLLCFINKKTIKIKTDYLLVYLFIGFIIFNPFYLFNIGFIYSFIISFFLIKYSVIMNNKSYFIKLFFTSYIAFIVSLPITINYNFEINLLSIINNLIFVPFVSILLFPLVLIDFFIPFITPIVSTFFDILENISLLLSSFNLNISLCYIPIYFVIIYYLIIIYILEMLKKGKYIYLFLIFMIIIIHYNYPSFNNEIHFLDVGQGDSALLRLKSNTIMIDTGGNINYEISKNILIPYLKSNSIKIIDYLILTHGDYDHMGGAINLVNNFKVKKVIFNCGEFNDLEQELIKVLDEKKISYYSCIKELNIDNNKLFFLQTKEYDNENDNSNVIYIEIKDYKFMFMGDAGIEKEKDILNKYNINNIDILKVGHHGSKTSSSEVFIDEINPKYSIISVGKKNKYGHPNKEVLNNLSNSKIYRTDEDGSIMFKIKNNKLKIETCAP